MRKFVQISFVIMILAVGGGISHLSAAQPQIPSYVQAEAQRDGYRLLDMNELWKLYQQAGKNLLLVDTRQDWEYQAGYIKGALNFPMEPTWLARITQRGALEQFLGPDKTRAIVFY